MSVESDSFNPSPLVCIRLHCQQSSSTPHIPTVLDVCASALTYSTHVIICVNAPEDFIHSLESALQSSITCPPKHITLIQVQPWGKFTFALNVAVQYAADNGYPWILFQSLEVTAHKSLIQDLMQLFRDELVCLVGPVLEGHNFNKGVNDLRGRTCPWNTLAIWRVSSLSLIGFPLVGNGAAGVEGGVEEVSAWALLHMLNPLWKAYLVSFTSTGGVSWSTGFEGDAERAAWQSKKMGSKDSRPAEHLRMLGVTSATVEHIEL